MIAARQFNMEFRVSSLEADFLGSDLVFATFFSNFLLFCFDKLGLMLSFPCL